MRKQKIIYSLKLLEPPLCCTPVHCIGSHVLMEKTNDFYTYTQTIDRIVYLNYVKSIFYKKSLFDL